MRCHACRSEIRLAAGEFLGFRDECETCRADLHVCLNCAHHDAAAYNECRETNAERVLDRDRANRCDYFRPEEGAESSNENRRQAFDDLQNLFKKS